ncbi:hypothetical protein HHL22_20255 [Hymenobacter sp. RP-2-7]|uniref:Uncharacterized protein n=1 Tax=Hymenobacter polaris TaxID=2682546 RepID=A0A7Y0AHL7_9BACT|nr:hypothetical protein [Hymenobacter polaris]NML67541.1 hypothetical protein [Hymenobacter polaris]
MNTASLSLRRPAALGLLLLALAGSGCSIFHRHRHEPPPAAVAPPPAAPLPPTAARDLADVMADVLKLQPDQTGKVRQILSETVAEVNAARQQHPAQSPELTAALTRINTASEGKLRQVLGTAKYKELQAKRPQIQAEMQRR